MNDRLPAVINGSPTERFEGDETVVDVIDLNDPKWGGGDEEEEVAPVMDEAWCRQRLWEIACLLRKQTLLNCPNQLVIGALSSEAAIVKALLPKDSAVGKKPNEVDDAELREKVEKLKAEGKL